MHEDPDRLALRGGRGMLEGHSPVLAVSRRAISRSGMTLTEVVLAVALTTLLFTGLIGGIVMGSRLSYTSTLHHTAFNQCRSRFETMRGAGYAAVPVDYLTPTSISLGRLGGAGTRAVNGTLYGVVWELSNPTRKHVYLVVWFRYLGRWQSQELHGVVYQKQQL